VALAKWYTFEEGVSGNAISAANDYTAVNGTVEFQSAAAEHGAIGMLSTSGGYLTVKTAAPDVGSFSVYFTIASSLTGSARIMTLLDSVNTFIGMFRAHSTNVFDICDASATRQAVSTYTWSVGTTYRLDGTLTGSGTARTMAVKVFVGEDNASPVWDSGPVAITSATASAWAAARVGAQSATGGTVAIDDVRFFDTAAFAGPVPDMALDKSGSGALTGTAATTFVLDVSTATPGSYVFVVVAWATSAATFTQASWTQLALLTTDSTMTVAVFYRRKLAADTTFTFTTQSGRGAWGWSSYSNLDPAAPYQAASNANLLKKNTAGANIPSPSVTNTNAAARAWAIAASRTSTSASKAITFTPDGALTERADQNMAAGTTSPWTAVEIADSGSAVTAAAHSYTAVANFSETHGMGGLFYLNPAPVSSVTLVVAGLTQAQPMTAPALAQVHALAVAGLAQAQSIAAPALAQVHQLAVAKLTQPQSLTAPAPTQAHQLAVQPLSQAQPLSAAALTQIHLLVVAKITQAQSLTGLSLAQQHGLAVAGLLQAQPVGSPLLVRNVALTVQGLLQAQPVTAPGLTQAHQLAVASVLQAQPVTAVAFTGGSSLVVADLRQAQQISQPALQQLHQLAVAAMTQGQALTVAVLGQLHQLAVASLAQAQTVASVPINSAAQLTVADIRQAQQETLISLAQTHLLAVDAVTQAQHLGPVALAQQHLLAVVDLLQQQRLTAPNLTVGELQFLYFWWAGGDTFIPVEIVGMLTEDGVVPAVLTVLEP
jgi:hypothetical protein